MPLTGIIFPFLDILRKQIIQAHFKKESFKVSTFSDTFSVSPLRAWTPLVFQKDALVVMVKNYINWLPVVDVLSSSLPHWGFGIEHLTFCFSKNMFSASQLPQQKMGRCLKCPIFYINSPLFMGPDVQFSFSVGIFFPQRVLIEPRLEILNCIKWIWGDLWRKLVGRPLIWELSPE